MSTVTRQPPSPLKWIPKRLGRLTVDQYDALVSSDVFRDQDNLVLINGYLVSKLTSKPRHVIASELLRDAMFDMVPRGTWRVMVEAPVRIPDYSEPEPDLSIARGTAANYTNRHPGPADLALVVEVARSSLAEDRRMAEIYGPAGIPEYWLINLKAQQIEVYSLNKRRGKRGYGKARIYKAGQSLPVVLDGEEVGRIAVAEILPSDDQSSDGERP